MPKDDATWLNVAYITFFALVSFFYYKALELVAIQTNIVESFEWFNLVATIVALGLGLATTYFLRADGERHDYFLSAIAELRKVTWPSWADTKRMTLVVVVVVGIFGVIVSAFDVAWAWALRHIIAA